MTGEGSEYGERRREIDEDETDRIVREIIDEVRKETEEREVSEAKEGHDESKDPEQCVREAIEEIKQEEAERLRAREEREEREQEKKEQLEESREEREEKADKDDFAELEERILENFDGYDIDPEEVKERWRERFKEEVKEQLDGTQKESEEADSENDERAGDEGRTAEDEVYYTDSSGQVHVVKTESDETAESKAESSVEAPEQPVESAEMSDTHDGQGADHRVEEGEVAPQDEHSSQTQEGVVEHPHARENEEGNGEVEKQFPETEPKEVAPEREKTTEGSDNPHPETEASSPEIDTEHRPAKEYQRQESDETSEADTSTEESKEEAESREKEIWRSYELENGSVEDEEWKRYLRELFSAISEEEREAFKEYLREQVQSIEDFEELLRKYGLEELLDEEGAMEEVRQFLEFKDALEADPEKTVEEIAEELGLEVEQALEWSRGESEPMSLKRLLNLEAYYLWDQIIRDYRERDFPKTQEELERALAEHSELRTSRFLPIEREEALAWIEITGMQRRGEIEKKIRNGREIYYRRQITELSEKHGIAVQEIIRWLRGEGVPTLIERTGKTATIHRREETVPKEIDVKEVHRLYFDEALSMPEVAKRLGLESTKLVRRIFKEQGWKPRPPGFQRPSVDLDEIHRLYYIEGWNLREIAREVGMDRHTLGKIFREQSWQTRRAAAIKGEFDVSELHYLHFEKGVPLRKVASLLGVSEWSIRKVFREQGWKPRPRSRSRPEKPVRTSTIKKHTGKALVRKQPKTRQSTRRRKQLDVELACSLYFENSMSVAEIAGMLGVSKSLLKRRFRERGVQRPSRKKEIDLDKASELYIEKRLSLHQVAGEFNVSISTLKSRFKEEGIRRPSRKKEIDLDKAHELYFEKRLSLRKVAEQLGVSVSTLQSRFREKNWRTRYVPPMHSIICDEDIHRLYFNEGLTKEEVARKLGIPYSQVRRVFKENAWKSRIRKFNSEEERQTAKEKSRLKLKQELVKLRERIFGRECRICGARKSEKTLFIHKKDGAEHDRDSLWRFEFLRKVDAEEWAALCPSCHAGVHWMMDMFGLGWKEIRNILQTRLNHNHEQTKPFYQPDDRNPPSSKFLEILRNPEAQDQDLRRLLFGDTCFHCGVHYRERILTVHRKDGRPHGKNMLRRKKYLRVLNPDDWISLCQRCHRETHWAMDTLSMGWEELEHMRLAGKSS